MPSFRLVLIGSLAFLSGMSASGGDAFRNPLTRSSTDRSRYLRREQKNIGLVSNKSNEHTVTFNVLLRDTQTLLDEDDQRELELHIITVLSKHIEELNIVTFVGIMVVDQRLHWSLADDRATTGLKIVCSATILTSSSVSSISLQQDLQSILDARAEAIQRSIMRQEAESSPESLRFRIVNNRAPIGYGAVALGSVSLILLLITGAVQMRKKTPNAKHDLSKTSIDEAPTEEEIVICRGHDFAVSHNITLCQINCHLAHVGYKVSDDEELTLDDTSFSASLVFCPSVVKPLRDPNQIFPCSESAIVANIGDETDSDESGLGYSPQSSSSSLLPVLTDTELQKFDDNLRRAEC
ncbi:hypothetical protein THAOC_09833 [Thalassiosira oceanica]|uniref:Uncharacterized protein n=1 Tax=Thalassiosira oceanica TaxID=159749 RepID=K0T6J2_THAOC|nr:hypothetical protein THAOC_09833 [Thalassiosira oceanica]|eukprot:EJK68951.1 hypothetical protein THAOC_09833 [Thalassiosira oceanica]